ncbi:hypothetical protein C4588_05785 [Candidatus Parcubacteria bacterium]|nr:MAG: hypothetical protein C4588_05785 [Candidatus Parcubacteria bacterium]
MSNSVAETIPELDIEQFEKRRYENYIREKNFLSVKKLDDDTFEVSNAVKNVFYRVTKSITDTGKVIAQCTCKDFSGRCLEYNPPARCKHVWACLDWKKSQEKQQQQKEKEEREEEKNMEVKKSFDPKQYLIQVKGKDYLQVVYRLHWFRQEKPLWGIKTEIVKLDLERGIAVVRADVFDENGVHKSSGLKMEYQKHFFDFCEKAETGAIGRSLAGLGYGTLQSLDMDEGLERERLVDAPVSLPSQNAATPSGKYSTSSRGGNGKTGSGGNGKSTGKIVETPPDVQRAIERW